MRALRTGRRRNLAGLPHLTITKDGDPYLTRWWLLPYGETRYRARRHMPAVLLHRIHRPDHDRAMHDHPWWFVTIVLRGGYVERRDVNGLVQVQYRRAGRWAFRRATDLHTIASVEENTWTVCVVGPKRREWGFMGPDGWVDWRTFTAGTGWTEHGVAS